MIATKGKSFSNRRFRSPICSRAIHMYYSKDKDINAYVKRLLKHKSFRIISGKKHDQLCIFEQRKLAIPSTPSKQRSYIEFKNTVKRILRELGVSNYEAIL